MGKRTSVKTMLIYNIILKEIRFKMFTRENLQFCILSTRFFVCLKLIDILK